MNTLRVLGMVLFIVGAALAILDLLDIVGVEFDANPFYLALGLMIIGISLTFKSQVVKQSRNAD